MHDAVWTIKGHDDTVAREEQVEDPLARREDDAADIPGTLFGEVIDHAKKSRPRRATGSPIDLARRVRATSARGSSLRAEAFDEL